MSKQYGKNFKQLNKIIKQYNFFFRCEACKGSKVTLHHIATNRERENEPVIADMARYMMLLCGTCHWYASRLVAQPFQEERRIELEKLISKDGFSVTEYMIKNCRQKVT